MEINKDQPTPPKPRKRFLVEDMFNQYLKNMNIDRRKILPFQLKETRRAFYGAIGMYQILQRDHIAAEGVTEDEAVGMIQDILDQVENFFANEMMGKN